VLDARRHRASGINLICAWAATIGGAIPLPNKRLRIDPAVVSAPMVVLGR
jgi:Mg/Co/Ni transporter MgtE